MKRILLALLVFMLLYSCTALADIVYLSSTSFGFDNVSKVDWGYSVCSICNAGTVTGTGGVYIVDDHSGGMYEHYQGSSAQYTLVSGITTYVVPATLYSLTCSYTPNTSCSGSNIFSESIYSGEGIATITYSEVITPQYGIDLFMFQSVVYASTPEPASLALVGSGLLGIVGVLRKRLLR